MSASILSLSSYLVFKLLVLPIVLDVSDSHHETGGERKVCEHGFLRKGSPITLPSLLREVAKLIELNRRRIVEHFTPSRSIETFDFSLMCIDSRPNPHSQ
jgi:hypothetical protein